MDNNKKEQRRNDKVIATLGGMGLEGSVEMFLTHFTYGEEQKNTTALIDSFGYLIAMFNRGSKYIDYVKTDLESDQKAIYLLKGTFKGLENVERKETKIKTKNKTAAQIYSLI